MSDTSPLPIPAAGEPSTADPFLALLTDCESADTSLSASFPALVSLTADLVARNNEWVQQALGQVVSTRSALLARKTRVLGSAKRLSRKQCKGFLADFEAADVSTEQLRVWAAVAVAGTGVLHPILDCGFAASPLFVSPPLVQSPVVEFSSSVVLPFGGDLGSVVTGDGLRVVSAAGPGLKWFEPHSRNEFSVVLAQAAWLDTGDVVVDVLPVVGSPTTSWVGVTAAAKRSELVRQFTVSVVYRDFSEDAPEAVLQLFVCGAAVADATGDSGWCVRVPRKPLAGHKCAASGTHVRTLAVVEGPKYGMAVSADEKWLVVGLLEEGELFVYSLPGGELVRTFGCEGDGPLQFDWLFRLHFAPNGNLLVVDHLNRRLHEVTLEGVFVRFIGVGDFGDGEPYCVAVHDDVIAVGCAGGTGPRVVLFDFGAGTVTSRFVEVGTTPGQLNAFCAGIRFTPDGSHVIVAEGDAKCLYIFTAAGVFVRCVCGGVLAGGFMDVLQSVSGEYVVADCFNHRVCVFSPDGSELVRSWGVLGTGVGQFEFPTTLAAAGQHLYVMERDDSRVQVFE